MDIVDDPHMEREQERKQITVRIRNYISPTRPRGGCAACLRARADICMAGCLVVADPNGFRGGGHGLMTGVVAASADNPRADDN